MLGKQGCAVANEPRPDGEVAVSVGLSGQGLQWQSLSHGDVEELSRRLEVIGAGAPRYVWSVAKCPGVAFRVGGPPKLVDQNDATTQKPRVRRLSTDLRQKPMSSMSTPRYSKRPSFYCVCEAQTRRIGGNGCASGHHPIQLHCRDHKCAG